MRQEWLFKYLEKDLCNSCCEGCAFYLLKVKCVGNLINPTQMSQSVTAKRSGPSHISIMVLLKQFIHCETTGFFQFDVDLNVLIYALGMTIAWRYNTTHNIL